MKKIAYTRDDGVMVYVGDVFGGRISFDENLENVKQYKAVFIGNVFDNPELFSKEELARYGSMEN